MIAGAWPGRLGQLARLVRALPAVVAVLWWLAVVELAVRTLPLPRVARLLGAPLAVDASSALATPVGGAVLRTGERRRLSALTRIAPHWPLCDGPCLRQALAAGHILRRHAPVLRIGAALDDRALRAHAWLEVDGATVGSAPGFEPLVAGWAP